MTAFEEAAIINTHINIHTRIPNTHRPPLLPASLSFFLTRQLHINTPMTAFEEAAKNAPAIIFIDEIDSIAPRSCKSPPLSP
jgi:hypothetical protein